MKNGYLPQYSSEVFNKVMEQVENFEEYSGAKDIRKERKGSEKTYQYGVDSNISMVAEKSVPYGKS